MRRIMKMSQAMLSILARINKALRNKPTTIVHPNMHKCPRCILRQNPGRW